MYLIREVVQQALATGYLTMAAEEQLRQLLQKKYSLEDLDAFIMLQQAAMVGQVKQESRELSNAQYFSPSNICNSKMEAELVKLGGGKGE